MAKKTNKTDHVLNLISGGGARQDAEGTEEVRSASTPPPVDPMAGVSPAVDTGAKSNSVSPINVSPNSTSPVSVVHTSTKEDHQIADSIKHSLEKELERAAAPIKKATHQRKTPVKQAYAVDAVVEELNAETVEEPIQEITADALKEIKEVQAKETVTYEDEVEDEEPQMEEKVNPDVEEEVYVDRFRKDLEVRLKEPTPEYTFVNVMEYLVRDKVIAYMKQFGNCTCSRCVEDTAALTLTHLPSKYVVVSKAAISPLLDYYGHKFAGQITVEITKACIKVNQNPHHDR